MTFCNIQGWVLCTHAEIIKWWVRSTHRRLRAAGKTAKVALTACMRKLLVILNAIMRTQQPWHPINA